MISFDGKSKTIRLDTANSSYCITIAQRGYIAHSYYGPKIGQDDVSYLTRQMEYPFGGSDFFREKLSLLDFLPQEMPTDGLGDFREAALAITNASGNNAVELKYKSHKIMEGSVKLQGLPGTFDSDFSKGQTLQLTAEDQTLGLTADLFYTIYDDTDAIVPVSTAPKKS